jgi:hypothetical protein
MSDNHMQPTHFSCPEKDFFAPAWRNTHEPGLVVDPFTAVG